MLDRQAHLHPLCSEDLADYACLSDGGRTEVATRVGRVGILIVEAVFDAAAQLEPLRHEIADGIGGADTERAAFAAIDDAVMRYADSDAIGDALFVPMIMAEMAGQLMVYKDVERPRRKRQKMAATGEAQPVGAFLNLPWEEAIAEFKARGLMSPDEFSRLLGTYADRSEEARALMLERVQDRVREMLVTAIEEGQTLREFSQALDAEADGLGITNQDPHYVETVFRTNVQSAYGAGRFRAMTDPDVMQARPYVEYRTVGDARVRPSHAALDRTVYRIDGQAWREIAPPNSYNCRCSVVSLSAEEARGLDIRDAIPEDGKPDEGFDGPPVRNIEESLL